jgi:lysophospholipase L1-like esterase
MSIRRGVMIVTAAALGCAAMAYVPYRYASSAKQRAELWETRWSRLRASPASLDRYREDNARLRREPRAGRVVFLGASVTEGFDVARVLNDGRAVNRGISGQLLWQEYLRLEDDVLSYAPSVVVPEVCATNFDARAPSLADTQRYYERLVESARARGVRPVLATVIPVTRAWARDEGGGEAIEGRIATMNAWIREYARAHGDALIDWAAAMADERGALRAELTDDGLHPNAAGYARMGQVVSGVL